VTDSSVDRDSRAAEREAKQQRLIEITDSEETLDDVEESRSGAESGTAASKIAKCNWMKLGV
jgi:hypothetical protein